MKKIFAILCSIALIATIFSSCGQKENNVNETSLSATENFTEELSEKEDNQSIEISAMTMNGPTAIGLSYFMDNADSGKISDNKYNFAIAKSSDEVVPKLVKGELDIASIPANLASVIYSKPESNIQVIGINTLGVLYILETGNTVNSVEDLRGKTILATGKNHTPEQVITYILNGNGMEIGKDVNIEWKSEPAECLAALNAEENAIAMLPQPFASAAQMKNKNIRSALNLTEEWDKLQEGKENPSTLVTGVVVAQKDFIENHPDALNAFIDHYKESVDFVNNNIDEASVLVEKYGVVKAPVAKKAIPACNITFIEGEEMKAKLSGYLEVLFNQNPKSVGGKLPDDNFYYAG